MQKVPQKRKKRSEIPVELTWKLEDLFQTPKDWESELLAIESDLDTVTKYKGRLHEGAKVLLECLHAQEELEKRIVRVATYASLHISGDSTNPVNQANYSRVSGLLATVGAQLSFIDSETLALPDGTIETYLKAEKELELFKITLRELAKKKPYTLSPETEKVLAALSEVFDAPYLVYERSKLSDMQFDSITDKEGNELPVSFALYEDQYEFSPDTDIRRKAYQSFVHTLDQYKNTFAAAYSTEVKKQITISKLRNYDNVTQMLLQSHDVTLDMYHNLLDIIQTELAPHMRKLANLRKRVLGLDKMLFCDLKAPLDPDFNPKTTYDEASNIILEALSIMGPEYTNIIKKGLTERWVDLAENVGKATGAFCSSPYGVHPFILITWTDTMRGAFVLAHELGHAGHFYLAGHNQTLSNTRPSRYFIEAPSTMNELLLGQHILANTTDKRMKRWILLQFLGTYYHNFVTHLLEGELQRRVYDFAEKGKALTALTLCEQKRDVLQKFWGDAVEIDESAGLTWMRQPHYYMGLYPYTYSGGLTASTAVAQLIREEGKPAVNRWLEVLKAGGTMTPLELMKHAGVDMSKPEPIRSAVAYVGSLVDELEKSFNE